MGHDIFHILTNWPVIVTPPHKHCICNSALKCSKGKGKGKVHPGTGHEGPEGEGRYSSTLSLTSALDGVGGERHAPAALPPVRLGTHCIGGWVDPRAGLDGCGKSCPPPRFDPRPVASRYSKWVIPARPEVQWHQLNVWIRSTRTSWECEQPAADSVPTAVHCATSHAGHLTVSVGIRLRASAPCVPRNFITLTAVSRGLRKPTFQGPTASLSSGLLTTWTLNPLRGCQSRRLLKLQSAAERFQFRYRKTC